MSSTFMTAPSLMFTSESVTEGHPDKMCDQISDAVVDACLAQDPMSRVACETAVKTGFVLLLGEVTTDAAVNYDSLVRDVVTDIGFDDSQKGFDGNTCAVQVAIAQQSPDIAVGVDAVSDDEESMIKSTGAGDQGMMFGFACNETESLMPLPIDLAHRLSRRLSEVRKNGDLPWLRPDGKSQVTIEYSKGVVSKVSSVLISAQHAPEVLQPEIRAAVIEHVINPTLPANLVEMEPEIYVNPTGRFIVGGPMGDAGLTGRKIIVDTYGGMGRHGGGAFSGKDCTKVDRSAAYAARWVAKTVVAAGLADRCEVQIAYAIGISHPLSVNVETFGTGQVSDEALIAGIDDVFDLRPGAIIRDLDLRRPIYRQTATYGHFGRTDIDLPWEYVSRAADLTSAAGA